MKCTLTDLELVEKIEEKVHTMCVTRKVPTMSIPANLDEDLDLLVTELAVRYLRLLEEKEDYTHNIN